MEKKNKDKMGILKFWGWQSRAVSLGCITIIMGYLMIYCTNTLGMPSALVGTLLMLSKLTDGVTDLFSGYIIDNTKSRWGKARPYEFCIIPLWVCTWLLFSCSSEWSLVVKSIWVFLMYTFVNSVFATLLVTNQTAYMVRAFPTQNQIIKVNSYGGIVVTLGCAVVSMLFPQLMGSMATSAAGWSRLVGMFAIPLAVIGLLRFVFVKETIDVGDAGADKLKLKNVIDVLKSNKHIWVVAGIGLFYNLSLGMNASSYYFTEVVGDIGKYTMIAALSMPMLIVMFIFPVAMKKYTVANLVAFGAIIGIIGGLINFAAQANMTLLMIGGACVAFAGLPIAYLSGMMILDCATYNEWTGIPRMESVMSSVSSFLNKIGSGVGAAVLGFGLSLGGYDEAMEGAQAGSALFSIRILYGIVPLLLFFAIFFIARSYKLGAMMPKINKELAEKRGA